MAEQRSYGAVENGIQNGYPGGAAIDKAQQGLNEIKVKVETFVREKPVAAIGIALVAGYVFAKIVTRR